MKWLLLRGLVREQRHWGDFKNNFETDLRKADPSAEGYTIDFAGFGTEAHRRSPFTIAKIVQDTRERWLKYGGGEWGLFAMSLGGMVALEWCSQFPEDFKKLVLVNSSVNRLSPFYHRMKPSNYKTVFSFLAKESMLEREEKMLKMTTNLTDHALRRRAEHQASFALPVKNVDSFAQLMAALRFRPPQKIKVPILVLSSLGDQLVDSSCSEAIAQYYGAQILKHPTANHDLPLDAPEWVGEQVQNWLQTQK